MKITKESSGDFQTLHPSRWDKLKPWQQVQEEIEENLLEPEKFDYSITLSHGPQLLHTMRHSNPIRCMTHYTTKKGEVFTTHGCHGSCSHVSIWTLEPENGVSLRRFEMPTIYSHLVFVTKHRVFMTFCELDMTVRIFTEPKSSCKEVGCRLSLTRVLCLVYNKDEDEVIAGGRGGIDRWKVAGAEHAAKLKAGKKFNIHISKDEWIYEVKLDYKHKLFLALCDNGIYIISYQWNKQIGFLPNWHVGSLTCCCQYRNEYIVTGSTDGTVMVWNGVVFNKVHEFQGHVDRITALHAHHQDPFVVSSSFDGAVYVWRMDNFQKFMRVDLGEKIYTMHLLSGEELFCQTEREINIFTLNQFFTIFAPVESSVFHLCLIQGHDDNASRILASTEDGSVRFFSPATGATVTICYPMPSFQVLTSFAYNNIESKLFTVLTGGDVLSVSCKVNPCNAIEILKPVSSDESVNCILSIKVVLGVKNEIEDVLILAGLRNGQISLLDSTMCTMTSVQAHKGYTSCLEVIAEIKECGTTLMDLPKVFISGGSDYVLKFWGFFVDCRGYVFLNLIKQINWFPMPVHLKAYHDTMAVVSVEKTRILQIFRLDSKKDGTKDFNLVPCTHSIDYDHCDKITALDMCPVLQLFATASKDGLVKVWDSGNDLVRELDFRYSIYGMCFANFRGDLIIGFQTNLVVVTIVNYLMYEQLEDIVIKQFKDDFREKPISYNHGAKPWFDPKTLPSYPTNLWKRRAAKSLDAEVPDSEHLLNVLERLPSSVDLNDILITPTERALGNRSRSSSQARRVSNARYGYARALNLTIAEDAQVEKIRRQSLKQSIFKDHCLKQFSASFRNSPTIFEESESGIPSEDLLIETLIFDSAENISSEEVEKEKFEITGEVFDDLIMELMPWERELLKKDMIIAPDGLIPNSVIRKKVNYVQEPLPSKSPWRLKSAPSHDPRFLPEGWNDKKEEPEILPRTPLSSPSEKELRLDDKGDQNEQIEVEVKEKHDIPEFDNVPVKAAKKIKPRKQREKYKRVQLKKHDLKRANLDLDVHKKKTMAVQEEKITFSPTTMMETLQDTDEMSGYAASTSSIKTDSRDLIPDVLLDLLKETWFPDCDHNADSILLNLIKLLASTDHNVVSLSSNFLGGIYHLMDLSDSYGDLIHDILLENLNCDNHVIVKTTLELIRKLEIKSRTLLETVLPILLSSDPDVRAECKLFVNHFAGVNCKDGLRRLMVDLEIIKSLDSCQTEQEALEILRRKLGLIGAIEDSRLTEWVEASVGGIYDNERKKMEKKTRQDSLVRRWSIKAKLKQSTKHESELPEVSAEDEELWEQLELLRKRVNKQSDTLKEEESDTEIPSADVLPCDSSHSQTKQGSTIKMRDESVEDLSTRVPCASRVSCYGESKDRASASPAEDESSPELWETPSTLSDDLMSYYSPSLDDYSDAFSENENPPHEKSADFDDYRDKSKSRVAVPESEKHRKKQITFFRPKLPKFLPEKKKAKNAKKLKQAALEKAAASNKKANVRKQRLMVLKSQKEKDATTTGPSKRLKQYAQLAECIKEDGDFIKKTLQDKSKEEIGKQISVTLKEADSSTSHVTVKQAGDGGDGGISEKWGRLQNIVRGGFIRESKCSTESILKKTDVLKKAESDQCSEKEAILKMRHKILQSLSDSQRMEVELTKEERVVVKRRLQQNKNEIYDKSNMKYEIITSEADTKQDVKILNKMLKRQQIRVGSPEDIEFIQLFLQDSNIELKELAQEYMSRSLQYKDSDVLEAYKDKDYISKLLLDHQDSGIHEFTSGDFARIPHIGQDSLHIDENYLKADLSHQDSGIARDLSDSSNFSHGTHPGARAVLKHEGTLSPVKSCSNVDDIHPPPRSKHDKGKRWQPYAEMVETKNDVLPPIKYVKDGPTQPGEAGLRLLHTVQFDKEKSLSERHRVQPMEARLSFHTQHQKYGKSDFGALKFKWTTEIPIHQTRPQSHHYRPPRLPYKDDQDYTWDNPLPPAPHKGSRTMLDSNHKFHEHYCQEYRLAKKKMHHYTSADIKKFILPRIVNTRELFKRYGHVTTRREFTKRQSELIKESSKMDISPPQILATKKLSTVKQNVSRQCALGFGKFNLPPISLNQLINGIKLRPVILLPEA